MTFAEGKKRVKLFSLHFVTRQLIHLRHFVKDKDNQSETLAVKQVVDDHPRFNLAPLTYYNEKSAILQLS